MIGKYEDAMRKFDGLAVPESVRFSTGPEESHEVGQLTNEYFQSVMDSLLLSRRALQAFFVIENRTLCREDGGGLDLRVTDDFDTSLWYEGVQPLASVRNVRDDPNWQVILFAKYSIMPTTRGKLEVLYGLDAE